MLTYVVIILLVVLCITMLCGCIKTPNKSEKISTNFTALLEPMQKSSIRVTYDSNTDKESPVGSSKIGGQPDLPADFDWFYYKGKSYNDIIERRPLSFLAQINCHDAGKFDKEHLLPHKGMLYFFYELATMTWGYDPNDKGSAKVYYYPGDISELKRTDFPADLAEEFKIPEISIKFSAQNELPDFEEFIEWHDEFEYDQWDAYDTAKNNLIPVASDGDNINKLLGYANLIQSGMLLSCEETTNGVNTGEAPDISEDKLRQYKANCTKWQLLFQLDSIHTESYEMLWGDVGRIYFYIKTEDLMKQNFDNCWLQLQCG